MSTATFSVLVAALAVVVSAVSQAATIRNTRKNAASALIASYLKDEASQLRIALAEYLHLSYDLDQGWSDYRAGRLSAWPGERYWDQAQREDQLYGTIRLYLDSARDEDLRFLEVFEKLRHDDNDLWKDRRDRAADAAVRMLSTRINRAVGDPLTS
jgi:hypothetical protein